MLWTLAWVLLGVVGFATLYILLRDLKGPVIGVYPRFEFDDGEALGFPGLDRLPRFSVISIRYKYLYAILFMTSETVRVIFPNRARFLLVHLGLLRRRILARGLADSETARRWKTEDYALAQQLEFHAPELITACPSIPEQDRARFAERAPELVEAAAQGRLYIVDHGPYLEGTEPFKRPGVLLYATRAYVLVRDGQPVLAAIASDRGVALPGDAEWMAARAMHAHGALLVCQIGLHLLTHLIAEVMGVAMYRKLRRGHPMRQLLQPFIGLVPFVNNGYGKEVLFGSIADTSSLTREGLHRLVKNTSRDTCGYFDAMGHLKRRGVEGLPGYVYGTETVRFYEVTSAGARELVDALYATDEAVAADAPLCAWLDELTTRLRWPTLAKTRAELSHFLGNLLHLSTFRHSVYHYRVYELYGVPGAAPSVIHEDGSPVDLVKQYAIEYYAYCMENSIPRWRCETSRHEELGVEHEPLAGPLDRMLERYAEVARGPYAGIKHTTISH